MERQTLAAVLLLVDASIPPQAADLEVVSWLGNAQVGYSVTGSQQSRRTSEVCW